MRQIQYASLQDVASDYHYYPTVERFSIFFFNVSDYIHRHVHTCVE